MQLWADVWHDFGGCSNMTLSEYFLFLINAYQGEPGLLAKLCMPGSECLFTRLRRLPRAFLLDSLLIIPSSCSCRIPLYLASRIQCKREGSGRSCGGTGHDIYCGGAGSEFVVASMWAALLIRTMPGCLLHCPEQSACAVQGRIKSHFTSCLQEALVDAGLSAPFVERDEVLAAMNESFGVKGWVTCDNR